MSPSTGHGSLLACSTGKDAEKHPLQLPIGRKGSDYRRAVVSLGGSGDPYSRMPDLVSGDRLEISGELELTTDAKTKPPAVGAPYSYAPCVDAKLILADSPDLVDEKKGHAVKVAALPSNTCTQERHHTLVTFEGISYPIPEDGLPWKGQSHLNLVLDAHSESAEKDQVLLIGQNEAPTKTLLDTVKGGMAKLNVVRYRGRPDPPARRTVARERRHTHIPVVKDHRTVIYSLRLVGLEKDEQLVMQAEVNLKNPHFFVVRVSAEVVVADSPSTTDPSAAIAEGCAFRGQLGQFNGTNCARDSTVTLRKYGTMRVLKSLPGHVFVNLAVTSASPEDGGVSPDPPAAIAALRRGFLEVRRFRAEVTG